MSPMPVSPDFIDPHKPKSYHFCMYSHVERNLKAIDSVLRTKLPDSMVALYAFGSRVRGDHSSGSDFDVLVVIENRTPAKERVVIETFVDEEIRSGLSFDPVIKDSSSFAEEQRLNTPFYENVTKEGIRI